MAVIQSSPLAAALVGVITELGRRSFSVAFPVLRDYIKHREELLEGSQLLFELYKAGDIKVFPLNRISEVLDAVTKADRSCGFMYPQSTHS